MSQQKTRKTTGRQRGLAFLSTLLLVSLSVNAFACTGVIVGKGLTKDGTSIFGRTEDLEPNHNKVFKVNPTKENAKGAVLLDETNGFRYELPEVSYRYTSISDINPAMGIFDEAGFNEHGLVMDATVSMSANEAAQKADPYVQDGIAETIMTSVVLPHAKTAREAVQLLAAIIDKQGAAEGNGLVLSDPNELWYMEIYTGHQYVAVRYPDDKFSVIPNAFVMGTVDLSDTDGVIASKGIVEIAKTAKIYQEVDQKIHLSKTYGSAVMDADRSRAYSGILSLNPKANITYEDEHYDFLQSADQPISLQDVMAMQRNRLENTGFKPMDAVHNEGEYKYPIANENTMEAHVFERKNGSTDTLWLAMSNPLYSPYLPFYGSIQATHESYLNTSDAYDEGSFYWLCDQLNKMAEADPSFAQAVREQIKGFEAKVMASHAENSQKAAKLSPQELADLATTAGKKNAQEAFELLKALVNDPNNKALYEKANEIRAAQIQARKP